MERLAENIGRDRCFIIEGKIDKKNIGIAVRKLQELDDGSKKPVLLCLNTKGGSTKEALYFYEQVKKTKVPVYALVGPGAVCMSAGIIVLLSAEKIFLSRSARLMLHSLQIKNYLPDYITYIEAKNFCRIHRSGKKEAKKMVKIYNERLNLEKYGLKANVILKNGTKEYFFSSDTDYDYDIRELVKNCEFID